jgi:hypothetical protein
LIEAELKGWATALRIALETKQREAAVFAIKEIVSIISAVCYCYDLFDGVQFPKETTEDD